ncbi:MULTISPECIES: MFS transporter [Burkholderia]|uniref:MFS transporter n=1 Tax=Burkholderia mayonis TaxID=1385591 RepID=A0A1B4FLV2_9BURK|nr:MULTISPECIES: MFS transporter [Burkholderia]AOJ04644.1 MFS transporter [Burkholderia mayonis]KVE38692.1 MFS transporter [Burkholderia sp. BDU5]KVE42100.1 MFS transporter [Burkholderia mayonis]
MPFSESVAEAPSAVATGYALSARNERIYLAYRVLTLAIIDRAIFVIFLMHKGFDAYQIGILQGVFFLANIVTEVPAGMFGDAFGRKRSVLLGLVAYCVYALGVIVSDGFAPFVCLYALLGVALALVYGSDTALLYDSLVVDGRVSHFNRVQLRANALGLISGAFAVLAGGLLQKVSWNAVYAAYFAIYAAALAAWCFAMEPPEAPTEKHTGRKDVTKELFAFIRGHWRSVALPILGFTVFAACTTPFFTFSQALFKENGFSVEHITWFFFAAQMLIGMVYLVMQRTMSFLGFYPVVLASTLLTAVVLASMFFNVAAVDFTGFFLVMIINPIVTVVANEYFNKRLPSRIRASFLSLIGLCMSLTIAVMYFLYSYLAQYLAIYKVMAATSLIAACACAIFVVARCFDTKEEA